MNFTLHTWQTKAERTWHVKKPTTHKASATALREALTNKQRNLSTVIYKFATRWYTEKNGPQPKTTVVQFCLGIKQTSKPTSIFHLTSFNRRTDGWWTNTSQNTTVFRLCPRGLTKKLGPLPWQFVLRTAESEGQAGHYLNMSYRFFSEPFQQWGSVHQICDYLKTNPPGLLEGLTRFPAGKIRR